MGNRLLVASALLAPALALADPPPVPAAPMFMGAPIGLLRQGIALDVDVEAGLRLHAGQGDDTRWWSSRARVGVLLFSEPAFLGIGVAGQLGPLDSASLGLEVQYTEVFHGFSADVGVFPLDTIGGTTLEAQLGWAVLGLEYQRRVSGPRDGDQALLAVVQVPLGVLFQMLLRDPPAVVHHH